MKYHTTFLAAAAALMSMASASPEAGCDQGVLGNPEEQVCLPNTPPLEIPWEDTHDDQLDSDLPCVEIIFRDNQCRFDSFMSAYSKAHSECMCSGASFADWLSCQKCLLDHGFFSEVDFYWSKILSSVSSALCTGAPTAAIVPSLPAQAQTDTAIPVPITPIAPIAPSNTDGSSQPPLETDSNLNQPATITQAPWVVNQTSVAITEAGPQQSCHVDASSGAPEFSKQNNTATARPTNQSVSTTVAVIPTGPTDLIGSVPSASVKEVFHLPPGVNSSSETSNAVSSFERSGLALAIAGGIILGGL